MSALAAFVAGALFSLGLVLAHMTEPARIIHFLDLTGEWDPTLVFVMAGAVLVYGLLFRLIRARLTRPLLSEQFHVPAASQLDASLFVGAALFGLGWGLAGLCPGPAIVSLGAGKLEAALFVAAMLAGSCAGSWLSRVQAARTRALAADDA